ncbi:OTU protein [Emydomyces testavorans]|uniref:OTU protein n=1 Tax=Emydomyces testavorans TaxID=2070801 RepID=A0AAF0IJZ9_9EURO|nr:OTU protein [Emydomyces testavorans]
MEDLQARHRKEQRDLQSRITQKKKSATKKTRKAVNDECDRWQRDLLERQHAEIAQFNGEPPSEALDDLHILEQNDEKATPPPLTNDQTTTCPSITPSSPPSEPAATSDARPKKPNRQKARLARRAAEREAEAELAASEAANQIDHRSNEQEAMRAVFTRLGLRERDIAPDGHCLYSAVATQLAEVGVGWGPIQGENGDDVGEEEEEQKSTTDAGYKAVRAATGRYVLANADDFAPFIEEPLGEYARKIMFTAEWGGQLELQAMARMYGVEINVIQGDGRIEKFEPGDENNTGEERKKIWLAYYRHSYGLGEHYNALTKIA